ncbi:aromatic ring-hydroxylating dioxygenase subunit alpha [Salinisphaera sp. USBA-960]|nr:aromatic ring-hydroxylating dioxygenase subunit alpha [Salifodinibacter halophilus]NNC25604.1 aromatic ring-hydroxylating dioxygenase subunit alpha [Salifodinibacter halophilus]
MNSVAGQNLASELAAVLAPAPKAQGLPSVLYTAPGVLEFERDQLFAETWAAVGFASDVSNGGDVQPLWWLGQPLIMLRDQDGQIRVFHNVCSHRGRQVVDAPCHVQNGLRCPYHFWLYGLDGQLKGTPHFGGANQHQCDGFDRGHHGLKSVDARVWCDLVFINMSGKGPSFEAFIAPLEKRWQSFWGEAGTESLVPGDHDSQHTLDVASNWKLAVENYCESYHLPMVHPDLNSYSPLEDHYIVLDEDGESFSGQGTMTYSFAETAGIELSRFPEWPQDKQRQAEYVSLYPNVLLGLQVDHFFVVLLEPIDEQHTREHVRIYYVADAATSPAYSEAREAQSRAWNTVFTEDISMVEGLQRGRASPACVGGVFSPVQDVATHHFHCWVARKLRWSLTREEPVDKSSSSDVADFASLT